MNKSTTEILLDNFRERAVKHYPMNISGTDIFFPPGEEPSWEACQCPHGRWFLLPTGQWIAKGDLIDMRHGVSFLETYLYLISFTHSACQDCQDWLKNPPPEGDTP